MATINVIGTLTLNGEINSKGSDYTFYSSHIISGGGSGGGINITTGNIEGSTGSISAKGGEGVNGNRNSGSGGGGRVHIGYTVDSYTGSIVSLPIDVNGGTGGQNPGLPGSINIVP